MPSWKSSSDPGRSCWVPLGRIGRPHGVRGALKIHPYGDTLASKEPGETLFASLPSSAERLPLTILSLQPYGPSWLARFREVPDRGAAEGLTGGEIVLPEDFLPPAEEDEYYYYQLVGLTVETRDGARIGELAHILETGSHDVYVVRCDDGREVLIPAVEEVILQVDLHTGRMRVDLPEGLMDAL